MKNTDFTQCDGCARLSGRNHGVPFRDAHGIAWENCTDVRIEKKIPLDELPLEESTERSRRYLKRRYL